MGEKNRETLERALDCIIYQNKPWGPLIDRNKKDIFPLLLTRLINEDVPIDLLEDRISTQTISSEIKKILLNISEEKKPHKSFEKEVNKYVSDLKNREPKTYTVLFPLNWKSIENVPKFFNEFNINIKRITQEKWIKKYEKCKDNNSLRKFVEKSPNNIRKEENTYWKAEIKARDPNFSIHFIKNAVNLILAKIHFSFYKWNLFPQKTPSKIPRFRWSRLRNPFIFLIFKKQEYKGFRATDLEKRNPEIIPWYDKKRREEFQKLPNFSLKDKSVKKILCDSLLFYQLGISECSIEKSFFSFYNSVKILSQAEEKSDVIQRAKFAFEFTFKDQNCQILELIDQNLNNYEDIIEKISYTGVSRKHQEFMKILADSLLQFYFENLEKFDKKENFSGLLKYGSLDNETRDRIIKYIQATERLNSE